MASLRVLRVLIEEPGGAPQYARLLTSLLEGRVESEIVALDPSDTGRSLTGWVRSLRTLRRTLKKSQASLVHAHGVRAAALVRLSLIGRRTPFLLTIHGLHSVRRNRGVARSLILWLNRAVLRAAERVCVLGASDRDTVLTEHLASPDRIVLTRPAVVAKPPIGRPEARRRLQIPESDLVALWLGRFSAQKDPWTMVKALKIMGPMNGFTLLMVGDGEMYPEIAEYVHRDRVPNCRLLGWMDDPAPVLAAANVYVNTSLWEGLPRSALEAAAQGLALVLTDCPGSRDLDAPGAGVIIVPVGDAAGLARRLSDLAGDASQAAEIGARTRATLAHEYNLDNMRKDVLTAYESISTG